LLQSKEAKHHRELYAIRAREKQLYKKRLRGKPISKREWDFLQARKKGEEESRAITRQFRKRKVRVYFQVAFVRKVKGVEARKAKNIRHKEKNRYRLDVDRGNYKVRVYSQYLKVTPKDMDNGNLSTRMRDKIPVFRRLFKKAKGYDKMSVSVQLFVGKVLNPYTGLIGKPSSITSHARMRSVSKKKDTGEVNGQEFSFEVTEFMNRIDYVEELGFLNYTAEEDPDE
jgi:hypothetical protein